jgi:hypothetical protein
MECIWPTTLIQWPVMEHNNLLYQLHLSINSKLLDITQPKVLTLSAAPCGMRMLFNAKEIGKILNKFKTG